jgi:RND superfamily putative drug exporter
MFRILGILVARTWPWLLAAWIAAFIALYLFAPAWDQIGQSGEFAYLPDNAPTRRAETSFDDAFLGKRSNSSIVLLALRSDGGELQTEDRQFVSEVLAPQLRQLLLPEGKPKPASGVTVIRAPGDGLSSLLLESQDRRADLVVVELSGEFLDTRNWPIVASIEKLIVDLANRAKTPKALEVLLTGSAVLGRDIGKAESQSASAVQRWTILIVVVLLLLIYRAPLLALLPLLTVFTAIEVALRLLGLLAQYQDLKLDQSVRLYVTVVGYGAGIDYCLFLIARCKEEWKSGAGATEGVQAAIAKVGAAVGASALTVVIGISMMGFADFGKIRHAGLGIAFSLAVVFVAALTLTPTLLCLTGRSVLWPNNRIIIPATESRVERAWVWVGQIIARRPRTIWLAAVALMTPFAIMAILQFHKVNYDLTRNVPPHAPSAIGLQRLREHLPAGTTSPVIVVMQNERLDFRTSDGNAAVAELSHRLLARAQELGLADVRCVAEPLGITAAAKEALSHIPSSLSASVKKPAADYSVGGSHGQATRIDLVLQSDPLSDRGQRDLERLEKVLATELPPSLHDGTQIQFLGSAASMSDLKSVTESDRWRVDLLVVVAITVVLIVLLRGPLLSGYLILTVVFGYSTTLGLTGLFFQALDPKTFPGLDWKVSFFLFTILVAVGEDYNIFLLSRVKEEQQQYGAIPGIISALGKSGGVITSCGLIMAGTFASLLSGSTSEIWQMGFALSCGVLLDTLIIRPILVPAFLIIVE